MQQMESQLKRYNHRSENRPGKGSQKKSSGINLKQFLVPKGKHRRSFTNQTEHGLQKQLEGLKDSFHIKNGSDAVNMGNYMRNMYEENYDFNSLNPNESPIRKEEINENSEQNRTETEFEEVVCVSQNLEKMKRLLVKMGEQLQKSQRRSRENGPNSKQQLHRMLTEIVDQLITERAMRSRQSQTGNQTFDSQGETYKTFIELESENYKSPGSYVKKNPRGYHGFCHKDIIKSIVKLEELITSENQGSLGEMGIITRNKKLINEKVSENTSKENITSILAESCSRVKGFTGEMDFNKPFYQKSVNDFDSYQQGSLIAAQRKLDELINQQLEGDEDERVFKEQRKIVDDFERRTAQKEPPKTRTTANLSSIQQSLTKFKKKRVSQRYILNSELNPDKKQIFDSLEELQKKVFTFDHHSSGKQLQKRSGQKIFEFIQSEGQIETPRESLGKSESQVTPETYSQNVDISQMELVESQLTAPKIERVEEKSEQEGKAQEERETDKQTSQTGTNWSIVNNTTNLSMKVLDSRQNMSMIHNINFHKLADSSNHHRVPFNSVGPSGPNSKRKVKSRDISDKQSKTHCRSQVPLLRQFG